MGQTVYLDDGTAAFSEHKVLKKKKLRSFSPLHKRIFPMLVGLSARINYHDGKIHFFTMYTELIEKNHPYLEYRLNELKYLKQEYKKKKVDKATVYFIGSPFYWNAPSLNTSSHIFEQVAINYKDKNVWYFPHRYEDDGHLEIVKRHGWEIVETGMPIELSLINSLHLPVEFGMFTSSAFYTINRLIPHVKFRSFELPNLSDIFNGHNTYELYREYEDNANIEVVKLN